MGVCLQWFRKPSWSNAVLPLTKHSKISATFEYFCQENAIIEHVFAYLWLLCSGVHMSNSCRYFHDKDGKDRQEVYHWWHLELADYFEDVTNVLRKIEVRKIILRKIILRKMIYVYVQYNDVNFVVTGVTTGCHNDNQWCRRWRQS